MWLSYETGDKYALLLVFPIKLTSGYNYFVTFSHSHSIERIDSSGLPMPGDDDAAQYIGLHKKDVQILLEKASAFWPLH
jgi:hypothetical protein